MHTAPSSSRSPHRRFSHLLALLVLLILCGPVAAQDHQPLMLVASPISGAVGQPIKLEIASIDYGPDTETAAPDSPSATSWGYSNLSTFSGSAFANAGAAAQSGNTITRLAADDITMSAGFGGQAVRRVHFTVANLNAVSVSARPRVRFYQDNAGVPGNYITGFTFNPIAFAASTVAQYYTLVSAGSFTLPASGVLWAGITFDDNTGTTGATLAEMNNLGQGIYNPPTVGSSADTFFLTTAAGSFLVNNPAGSLGNFGGSPLANFGWAFGTCAATSLTPASLPDGTVDAAYSVTFNQTGGVAPVTFAVTAGSLPPDLTLSGGGVLSGTPTTAGAYNFTVTATDQTGCTDAATYDLVIHEPSAVTLGAFGGATALPVAMPLAAVLAGVAGVVLLWKRRG